MITLLRMGTPIDCKHWKSDAHDTILSCMRKQSVSLTIDPDVLEKLAKAAKRQERSKSEVASRTLRAAIDADGRVLVAKADSDE